MHEIYDMYSNLPPTPKAVPKSAPAEITTFTHAQSKWAYFGEKRAESSRDRDEEGEERKGDRIRREREREREMEINVAREENMV